MNPRKKKWFRWLSNIMIASMLLSILSPFVTQTVYADDTSPLSLVQTVSSTTVGPNQEITVELGYSTASTTDNFYNVTIEYILPLGASFDEVVRSGHVLDDSYDPVTRTVTFQMGNNNPDPDIGESRELFPAGVSGTVEIKFHFPLPSVYPDGAMIPFNSGTISWNLNALDGDRQSANSNSTVISYELPASWVIEKSGPATAVISNNPSQTELQLTYTISLSGGNISLKDVEIVDTLPADSTLVSSTISSIGGSENTSGNTVTWSIPDVPAGVITSFNVTLAFAIDRGLGEGVVSGDSRTNEVTVTGYPIHIQEDGSYSKWNEQVAFLKNYDEAATTFNTSTAAWGVWTSGDTLVTLSQDPTEDKVEVNYTLGIDGGDMDMEEVFLYYVLPEDAEAVADSVYASGGSYDPATHTITWVIGNLSGNSSVSKNVTVEYEIDRTADGNGSGVSDGDTRTNTVTAIGKAAGGGEDNIIVNPASDEITTTFISSTAYWSVSKTGPSSVILTHDGDSYIDVTYTISLQSTGQGNIPLSTVTITDVMPADATYQSATIAPTTNVGNTLTWEFSNVEPSNPPSFQVTIRYAVDREGSGGVIPGDSLTNAVTVEAYPITGSGGTSTEPYVFEAGNGGDSVETTFSGDAIPNPQFSLNILDFNKTTQDKHFDIGDEVVYLLDFNNLNHNGETLYNAVLTDASLPSQIDYAQISLGESSASVAYTFEYQTNQNGWTAYGGVYNTVTETVIDISDLNLAVGEVLTGIRLSYADPIPTGFQFTEKIQLIGTVNNTAGHDTNIGNSATLDYQHRVFEDMSEVKTLNDSVSFKVLYDTAWISQLQKNKLTEAANYQHYTLETVRFEWIAKNDARLATDDFHNPVFVDVVPAGFEYVGNESGYESWESSLGTSGLPAPQYFTQYKNYPSQGETTLIWSWDNGAVLKMGEIVKLKYDLKIKSYAGVGTHTNQLFMYGTGAYGAANGINIITDDSDLDKDADTAEELLEGIPTNIIVRETAAINSYKWVKGELDADYHRYPNEGYTSPGGAADYKLEVINAGNTYIKDIEIIDILPYIGDTAVLSSTPRGSEWRPYLIEALLQGVLQPIVIDVYGNSTNADIEVYYSTASNPIRKGQSNQTIGTQEPNWSLTPPQDITTVRSLKFVVKNFAEHAKGLKPGSTVEIDWRMRAPIGTPVDAVAWNSISMAATTVNYEGSEVSLLPAEPNMVGIKVQSNPLGEIGDFVWFDKNGDGTQNDGYDQQAAGINGIKVHLHQYKEDSGSWPIVDTTLSGNDQDGNPGYYLFPNLETGEYYVSFEVPAYYTITSTNTGGDSSHDSDGYADSGIVRTAAVNINADNPDLRINHDLDLGLIASDPGLNLTKEAVGYRSNGATVDFNGTKVPVNAGETVLYRITVENNGNIPLHNIRLEDMMNNPGFMFTGASYNGNPEFTSFSLDPNLEFSEAEENILTIYKLEVGASYEFEAEYKVLDADMTGDPLENTLKVWANELKDQTDPDSPYKEAKEEVDLAAMHLEKTVSQIKKNDSDSFVDVTAVEDLGIEVGDVIKYRIIVHNDGSVNLENVVINDAKAGLVNYVLPLVPAGGTAYVEVEYTVTEADQPGPIRNTAAATHPDIRYEVTDDLEVHFKGLAITKDVTMINGIPAVKQDGKYIAHVGDIIEYTVTFRNTDDSPLKDVTIVKDELTSTKSTSDLLVSNVIVASTLAAGNSVEYKIYYTVQPEDIASTETTETIHNHVWGKSAYTSVKESGVDVEIAHLTVEKTADKTSYTVGETVHYTITVTNKGTIPLEDVTIHDPMLGIDETISYLEVDESKTFTGSYVVTAEDLVNGSIVNTVTVDSDTTEEQTDTVTVTVRKKSSGGGGSSPTDPVDPVDPINPTDPEQLGQTEEQPDQTEGESEQTKQTPENTPISGVVDIPENGDSTVGKEPTHGQITIDEGGKWVYTPEPGFVGKDSFTIIITDENGNEEEIYFEIEVEPIPLGTVDTLPKTGESDRTRFYLTGILLIFMGVILRRKRV